jgi:tetratricopeptide (TPR) repeat protein
LAITATIPDRSRRELALAWMNRGHGQLLLNNPAGDGAALAAYEQAIALLRPVPAHDPSWANSLGAGLMNYGQLLHRVHGLTRAQAALAAFDEAVAVLRPLAAGENPWPRRNLAGAQLNRANLLLDLRRYAEAAATARDALDLSRPTENSALVDADLALKARRALGDALGQLLVASGAEQNALASEASDVVDEALALTRHWAAGGESAFRELSLRFLRYGASLYRIHQPQFLAEFLGENQPLAGESRAIALEAIDAALADRPPGAYLTIGDPATERHLQTRRELETLRAQLAP